MHSYLCAGRRLYRVGFAVLVGFPVVTLLQVPAAADGATEPDRQPSPVAIDPSSVPELPDGPSVWCGPEVPLELRNAEPFGPEDKGATYTDMGLPDAVTTDRETALLELARAAVEAARLAGTLHGTPATPVAPPVPEDALRQKHEALATMPPAVPIPGSGAPTDPAVLGRAVPPVSGAATLTPAEREKLAATAGRTGLVVLPEPETALTQPEGAPSRGPAFDPAVVPPAGPAGTEPTQAEPRAELEVTDPIPLPRPAETGGVSPRDTRKEGR